MSQSWCWPAGRQGWGPRGPRADASLLVCWLCPDKAGCRAAGDHGAGVHPLVRKAGRWDRSQGGWLRDPRCLSATVGLLVGVAGPRASASPLVGGAEAQEVPGLMLPHWYMEAGPSFSGCRALGVLELVCQPAGGRGWGPGVPEAGICTLGCETGSEARAASLGVRAGS